MPVGVIVCVHMCEDTLIALSDNLQIIPNNFARKIRKPISSQFKV